MRQSIITNACNQLYVDSHIQTISHILAEVLVMSGSLCGSELPKLLKASDQTEIPLGRILVMCRRLTEDELQTALTAAQLVKSEKLSTTEAAILIAYCFYCHLPFNTVWEKAAYREADAVTLLLVTSGCLATARIERLFAAFPGSKKVCGKDLYHAGLISLRKWHEVLGTALEIRGKTQTAKDVMCEDPGTTTGGFDVLEPIDEKPWEKLGNLMLMAGLIEEEPLYAALEDSLSCGKLLGQILINARLISNNQLVGALEMQKLLALNSIDTQQAVHFLRPFAQPLSA